jgi:hypothetical protein
LLDELHAELARTGISDVLAPSVGADHPKILNSLREILLAVERDASPGAFIAGGVATLFAGERLKSIRASLERLPGLLLERVQRTLASQKILVLRTLLSLPVPDFLDVLGHATNENSNSSVLAWLLNPRMAPTVGPATLTRLVACLEGSEHWRGRIRAAVQRDAITVQRECPVAEEGTDEVKPRRIDIVVWGPDFMLAIENKVLAREHGEQTTAYWDWLATHQIAHAGIFLSPTGSPAGSQNFKPLSYLELLAALLEGPAQRKPGPAEELVLASYLKTLASGLLRTELRAIFEMEDRAQ